MKILAIADEESKSLWDYYDPERLRGVDLILSAGDLSPAYLEFLVTLTNCTLLYVRGNHDSRYDKEPPGGCICIEDTIYNYKGLRILGLGGCMRYNSGDNQYTENEMRWRVRRAEIRAVLMNGFDIMLTHAPARGYGDMNDLPHMGFECFNPLLAKWKPRYFIHGHVHKSYGHFNPVATHSGGTTIVNCFDHQIIDFPESDFPARGQTGSPFYDLYISLQERKLL
jgi:predicted phosphodiesterase